MSQFEVGKIYNTLSGHAVRIVGRDGSMVVGSDGLLRHDGVASAVSAGVLFWGAFEDTLNLVVPPPPKQPNITLLIDELVMSWATRSNSLDLAARRVAARAALEAATQKLKKDSA